MEKTFTQDEVNRIAAREKQQGEAAGRKAAEEAAKARESELEAMISAKLEMGAWDTFAAAALNGMVQKGNGDPAAYAELAAQAADALVERRRQRRK